MKRLLGNVSDIHTPKINLNFRRTATPPSDSYGLLDGFDLIEDQLLFSTTNTFNDKDTGKLLIGKSLSLLEYHPMKILIIYVTFSVFIYFLFCLFNF